MRVRVGVRVRVRTGVRVRVRVRVGTCTNVLAQGRISATGQKIVSSQTTQGLEIGLWLGVRVFLW